jgi:hypothetical protein
MPIPESIQEENAVQELTELAEDITEAHTRRNSLNLSLLDYIEPYETGPKLSMLPGYQPATGIAETILTETTESKDNLKIGSVRVKNEGSNLVIEVRVRYKPEDEDEYETDRWGYTKTDYYKACTIVGLSESEKALVEAFVPLAVEEAEGFADFRNNATKTTSPLDRLKEITLPNPDDVEDDIRRYIQTKRRADELDEKIKHTDQRIDEIVYDLYGLTEDEITTVKEASAS